MAPDGQVARAAHDRLVAAAQAEIADGKTPEQVIQEVGGNKADKNVVAVVREAATNQAAKNLRDAQKDSTDNPSASNTRALDAAKTQFNTAVRNEIRDSKFEYSVKDAGNNIALRLQSLGISEFSGQISSITSAVQQGK